MRIDFRQGIITYPEVTNQGQAFIQSVGGGVFNITAASGETRVTFAHKTADYLHVEPNNKAAWSGVPTSGDAWLYWDIDPQTADVTYGYTVVQPTSGSTQPTTQTDLHWFDTVNNVMKVYANGRFLEKIRVFAARINGTSIYPLGSNTALPYAGTQVGLNPATPVYAGLILFSAGLPVIINSPYGSNSPSSGNPFSRSYIFATTETEFITGGSQKVNAIRLESDFVTAAAAQNLAAFNVVRFDSDGRVSPASYNDAQITTVGITTDAASTGSLATIILQGVIRNEQWNWDTVGQELFITTAGNLSPTDLNITNSSQYPKSRPPVARVINSKEIIFMQGLGKIGPRGICSESIDNIQDVQIDNALEFEVIQYGGSPKLWRNSYVRLNELSDVELSSLSSGETLIFSGSPQRWHNAPSTSTSLAGLTDTNFGSPITQGDILYYDGSEWLNLSVGTAGQVLTVVASIPSWATPASSIDTLNGTNFGSPAGQGDIIYYDGSNWVNLPRGTDDQVLTIGSPLGVPSWKAPILDVNFGSPIVQGDIIYYDGSNWVNLPRGTEDQVLTMGSPFGVPSWTDSETNILTGLSDTTIGSPSIENDVLTFNGTVWINQRPKVQPVERNTSSAFIVTDATRGITSSTAGSPVVGSPQIQWTLNAAIFAEGDVITLQRRLNAQNVGVYPGDNVTIVSVDDGTVITGSPSTQHFQLNNPSQATLWLVEQSGSPSPTTEEWYVNGTNLTFITS